MENPVDQEISAIKVLLEALSPLSEKARKSVLGYVMSRLDIGNVDNTTSLVAGNLEIQTSTTNSGKVHIKQFKEQKNPRSANEMAAIVGYYLKELASTSDRKDIISQKDAETYFKIAGYPLPEQPRTILANAKTAGYFDSTGEGSYRLNAVGHNLVVHSLPRSSESIIVRARKHRAKKAKAK
jgi:hypothetical protein